MKKLRIAVVSTARVYRDFVHRDNFWPPINIRYVHVAAENDIRGQHFDGAIKLYSSNESLHHELWAMLEHIIPQDT